jgi:O-antigen/teichoic acid export membrane protein
MSGAEVRRRASAGLLYIMSSGAVLLVTGFAGNLVLARLLTPQDFGAIALGMVVILLATTIGDGGLVAGLVRREHDPTSRELRTLMGVQLLGSTTVALLAGAIALQFGRNGAIAAVMLVSFPVSALQGTGRVVLTRQLKFSKISLVDVVSAIAFYAWAIPLAFAGWGAWSMATAVVVRSATSSLLFLSLSGVGRIRPSLRGVGAMMPTIRFGITFQLAWVANVAREQSLNAGAGAIMGVGPLGIWALATRLMQLPLVVFQSVWHVSFPTMSHLLNSQRDPSPILERAARIAAVVSVVVMAPFAASAPGLVPAVFGQQWEDTGAVLPLCSLGLFLIGPVSAAANGYLYAAGSPRDVVRAVVMASVVMVPLSFALMPALGVIAIGIATIVSGIIESTVLGRAVHRLCGARLLRQVAPPTVVGTVAGAAGLAVDYALGTTLAAGIVGAAVALVIALLGLLLANREELVSSVSIAREAIGNVRPAAS